MDKKFLILLGVIFMLFSSTAQAAGISIQDNRATADYWVGKNKSGENVFVATADLDMLNLQIRQKSSNTIVDLVNYPEKVYTQWMTNKITATMKIGKFDRDELPKLFKNGTAITDFSYTQAKKNCGLDALPAVCVVRYALTVDRTNLRLLPEEAGWFTSESDTHYDQLQGTVIDPGEPIIVLIDSQDKEFVFVESRTYAGWVKPSALAFTDKATWMKYAAPQNYLTVIASRKTIPQGQAFYQMGGRVLLRAPDLQKDGSWAVTTPGIDANGVIIENGFNIPNDKGVVKGVLACSENNLIRQAFRFLGEGYGWGGLENNVDCSSFAQDVYRSVGIEIPRDADKQEKAMTNSISLNNMNREQRLEILKKTKPGSLLFTKGHVMIYLGTDDNGEPLVIHAASSYFTFDDGQTVKHYIRKVVVSDLHFMSKDKVEMIDRLTSVGNF
ncbi:MAG: SH3 domain-containing protein [Selenomonadaceae bacterium]|nr:SH3 domain-containing protein [Selenomonadaceae bacterium]